MIFTFGVYQELYQHMASEPDNPFSGQKPAVIDLVGTLAASLQTMLAPLATALCKRFSPRMVIALGGLLLALAGVLASYSHTMWQFILTQGVLMGLATCLSYISAVTIAPTHYGKRRALALGIITAGTGVGGVMWGPVIQVLNARLGYRQGLRISGAICGLTIMLCGQALDWDQASKLRLAAERRALSGTSRNFSSLLPNIDWRIAKTPSFIASALGAGLQASVYYAPVFYFSAYARTLGYGRAAGANLIAVNNGCNAVGKIAIGILADRYGRINALLLSTGISAAATLVLWLPSAMLASRGAFVAYVILYGLFASAYVSLFPASLVELFGPAHFRNVNGVLYAIRGLAALAGTPTAGALIRNYNPADPQRNNPSSYWPTITFSGILFAAATAAVGWVRVEASRTLAKEGWKL